MQNIRFCQEIMTFFETKGVSILNLVLALAGNQSAHSPTELALNPLYMFKYSSISDAIDNFFTKEKDPKKPKINDKSEAKLRKLLKDFFPEKFSHKFWLLNTDVTSIYREYSPTFEEKEYVYAANMVIKGNKPITIGIRLSTVCLSARQLGIAWNPPISMLKVPFTQKNSEFAAEQIKTIVLDEELFGNDLVINGLDSAYCNNGYTYPTYAIQNLVNIIRIAGNRNVFHIYKGEIKIGKGKKNRYGNVFKLPDVQTHTAPDQTDNFIFTMKNQCECTVNIKLWKNMILSGKQNIKMYDKPFHLVSIQLIANQTGKPVYKNTLWLTVLGQRRNELTLREIYESFRARFDIEFFFRFGKQRLLLDKYQTPDIEHQQNWFWIVMLAYWLLYLSRIEGENIIRPWEKYNAKYKNQDVKEPLNKIVKTPTQTQRAMPTIFCDFAKNNLIPKPRNIYSGRKKGKFQTPRERFNVLKKGVKLQI